MSAPIKDYSGQVFGPLTVISIAATDPVRWLCRCVCGQERVLYMQHVKGTKACSGHTKTPLSERFWSKIQKGAPSECWLWTAAFNGKGYGVLRGEGKSNVLASRASFFLAHGRWPAGCVRHKCDTPACVNPRHLVEGTQAENMNDMVFRDRQARGTRMPHATATDELVRQIRAATGTQREIALRFGVAQSKVCNIRNRKAWKHVV